MMNLWIPLLFACGTPPAESDDSAAVEDTDTAASEPESRDRDGDGFPDDEDCADRDAAINPDAPERANGVDDNCDGIVDDPVLASNADAVVHGTSKGDELGSGAVFVDGVLWLGAPGSNVEVGGEGRLLAFGEGASGELTEGDAVAEIRGADFGQAIGRTLAAFDLDGDGLDELAASAPGSSAVLVFQPRFTGITSSQSAILRLRGGGASDAFGTAIVGDDFDGNGTLDIALSAPLADVSSAVDAGDEGAVFFAYSLGVTTVIDLRPASVGAGAGSLAGAAMASGDVDGDGALDLLVGAPGAGGSGRVYLLSEEPPASLADATVVFDQSLRGDRAGAALDGADLDGDGFGDFVVGAPGVRRVWICYGGAQLNDASGIVPGAEITNIDKEFGSSVALVDLDGDAVLDIAAGDADGNARVYPGPFEGSYETPSLVIADRSGGSLHVGGGNHLLVTDAADEGVAWAFGGWMP